MGSSSDEAKIVGREDSYSEAVEMLRLGESDPILIKIPDKTRVVTTEPAVNLIAIVFLLRP